MRYKSMKAMQASRYAGLVGFFLLIHGWSIGQDSFRKVRLGLTFSPSLGWISPDNDGYSGDGVRAGMRYGLFANFALFQTENYSLQTGVQLSHWGGKLSYNDAYQLQNGIFLPAKTDATYKLRYVEVPLAIKLRTNEIGYLYYYGVFGGQFGVNIRARADQEINYGATETRNDVDIRDDVELFRADLVFGGGVEYNITGETRIVAGIYYHNGLTNILKGRAYQVRNGTTVIDNNGQPVNDQKLRNRLHVLELKLGVLF